MQSMNNKNECKQLMQELAKQQKNNTIEINQQISELMDQHG